MTLKSEGSEGRFLAKLSSLLTKTLKRRFFWKIFFL